MYIDLSGAWQCECMGKTYTAYLPGTLDENKIGMQDTGGDTWHPDAKANAVMQSDKNCIVTRLTRKYTYEGQAVFSRQLLWQVPENKRIFVECERSRKLSLCVNGKAAPMVNPGTISTPYVFEVTGLMNGCDHLVFTCDNHYPDWPRDSIVYSSAATDETQTNWNGLLGYLRLRIENSTFISAIRVYPKGKTLDVAVDISADAEWQGTVILRSDALAEKVAAEVQGKTGEQTIWLRGLSLANNVCQWDEEQGHLYTMIAQLGTEEKSVRFGIRYFRAENGRLTLNGRPVFLRSEANCAAFPQTGYPPMDVESWHEILSRYRSYGVNCVRFHSHCPPEAAFIAADELGMLMQPELSHWNPKDAFASIESQEYYKTEIEQILKTLANHPSFVMMTLGNELQADPAGHSYMAEMLDHARSTDPTRLYANGSNVHYGMHGHDSHSDFYTSSNYYEYPLRATNANMQGWLNQKYPDAPVNYDSAISALKKKTMQPVFSFEVGQYEILPDFEQLGGYTGITIPDNIKRIQQGAAAKGMLDQWKKYVEATGELSLLCYRAEVEAALATEDLSGISLLGLQDFPGQGTALVGMMDSLLQPKPYEFARPERFAAFFSGTLPLALIGHRTYLNTQTLQIPLRMANYGRKELCEQAEWSLTGSVSLHGRLAKTNVPCGSLTDIGTIETELSEIQNPCCLNLHIRFGEYENNYSIWVYPDEHISCPDKVYECRTFDERAKAVLEEGGIVYLAPDSTADALPHSIQAQFSTDFWSVGTFPDQEGGMGQLINKQHPIFTAFPTACHTDWQWWPMASNRAAIMPERYHAIIEVMDSYAYLRPMVQLLECRCGKGKLLFSTMGLHQMSSYPEAQALQNAIYRYLASEQFVPEQVIEADVFARLVPIVPQENQRN